MVCETSCAKVVMGSAGLAPEARNTSSKKRDALDFISTFGTERARPPGQGHAKASFVRKSTPTRPGASARFSPSRRPAYTWGTVAYHGELGLEREKVK